MSSTQSAPTPDSGEQRASLEAQEQRVRRLGVMAEPAYPPQARQEEYVRMSQEIARTLASDDDAAFNQVFAAAFNVLDLLANVPKQQRVQAATHLMEATENAVRATFSPGRARVTAPALVVSVFSDPVYNANFRKLIENPEAILEARERIVGGLPTQANDFPDCVAVGSQFDFCCSGTLVARNVVVTAGHCDAGECRSRIFIGLDVRDPTHGRIIKVAQSVRHPQYHQGGRQNDLAVLILEQDVTGVQPRAISSTAAFNAVQSFRLVGYGNTDPNSTQGFGRQRKVDVPRASDNPAFGADQGFEFVAGRPALNKDSCNGDSGGPAYLSRNGQFFVVGATSRATNNSQHPCGDGGIYVRLDQYVDFIRSVPGGHWS